MIRFARCLFSAVAGAAVCVGGFAAEIPVKVIVDLAQPGHAVSPLLHGVFFEDINFGADGGLYAELVQNRSFEHDEHLYSWGIVNRGGSGDLTIEHDAPLNAKNPNYARLVVREAGKGFGVANYGFGGIAVKAGENYLVSIRARSDAIAKLTAVLEDDTGRTIGSAVLEGIGGEWKKFEATIKPASAATHARLVVLASAPGRVDLDVISLFPEHTFKNRRNGMRADLAQMLADLKPAFMRFPGGCIVEGMDLPNRYQWKDTIGDIAERPQNWNRWRDAIRREPAPQYYQTYGLGFFEYFQLCEDVGAEPVPILNCGMACQYQSKQLVPLDRLDPFVQDALDLIEFANGPATSAWGAKRAAMGHPEPFNLKFIGVGNEQWGDDYFARYQIFTAALRAKYPKIKIVTGAGPGVDDKSWQFAWEKFRSGTAADIVDEHYYRLPQWFLENATRYDRQDRSGPRVFAGEFAAHEPDRRSTLRAAMSEAAFITGLVRNSDLVTMSSFAPLFAREGAYQWRPDLIWFDNTRVYGTGSYYVQLLYSRNRPDAVLPTQVEGAPVALSLLEPKAAATYGATALPPYRPEFIPTLYAVAGQDQRANETVLFLVNPFPEPRAATIELRGAKGGATEARAIVLTSADRNDVNSFAEPRKIAPHEEKFAVSGGAFGRTLPANSFTVLRVPR
jgi:alpha-N-arabinofuranosidase